MYQSSFFPLFYLYTRKGTELLANCFRGANKLHTDLGDIKIEVFCEAVPKTAENFLALCASGKYDNVLIHRNVSYDVVVYIFLYTHLLPTSFKFSPKQPQK